MPGRLVMRNISTERCAGPAPDDPREGPGHVVEITGRGSETVGHDPENTGRDAPKYPPTSYACPF